MIEEGKFPIWGIHIQTKSTFICGINGVGGGLEISEAKLSQQTFPVHFQWRTQNTVNRKNWNFGLRFTFPFGFFFFAEQSSSLCLHEHPRMSCIPSNRKNETLNTSYWGQHCSPPFSDQVLHDACGESLPVNLISQSFYFLLPSPHGKWWKVFLCKGVFIQVFFPFFLSQFLLFGIFLSCPNHHHSSSAFFSQSAYKTQSSKIFICYFMKITSSFTASSQSSAWSNVPCKQIREASVLALHSASISYRCIDPLHSTLMIDVIYTTGILMWVSVIFVESK